MRMVRSGETAGRLAERAPAASWAALAAALAVSVAPSMASAQTGAVTPIPTAPTDQAEMVNLEADELIDDQAANTITAVGDVQVRHLGRTMRADRLIYDLSTGSIRAEGDVEIVDADGSVTYAQQVEADEAMNVAVATELRARLGSQGTLAARAALRHGPGESELRRVVYTSCPICEGGDRPPTWSLRARRAIQDQESRTISYQGATIEVIGVPMLYLPYFAHPDPSVGRASGLLTPDIGRNRRLGTYYEQPYYWAISPHQDMTVSARLHTNVQPLFGVEYRKRFWSGELEIDTTFTQEREFDSNGNLFGDETLRSGLFAKGRFDINDYWQWGFGAERISDDLYLRRYDLLGPGVQRGPFVGQDLRLISQLYAIGQDETSYTSISTVSFQGLRAGDSQDLLPLLLPLAEMERVYTEPLLDGQVRFQVNTAALSRSIGADSARLSTGATWRRDALFGPGMIFSPFAQVRGDVFHVETTPDNFETFGRALGLAGAEVSWPFMRPGESFDLIVEPVAMAAIATDEQPDPRIVNEDSLAWELDDTSLFRPNAAPNYDLWEPGARVSLGVRATARARTGQSASVLFGRRWRDEVAPGFTVINNLEGRASDWVGAIQADLGRNFATEAKFRLEDESLALQRLDLGVRGAIGRFSASARYFQIDQTLAPGNPNEEVSGYMGVELARGWRMQLGLTRDLDSDINLRQELRAIYEDDCTFLEISYTRSETLDRSLGSDEGLQIRIGLRSLGVFGGS
ncbi:outer membrane protein Imp [alpha proteobacterium U9-1i]|nr:outer membrane protein Imp [alpha proteobacterium U9-1i]